MGACITKKSNIVIKKINRNLKQQIGSPEIKTSKYQSSKNFNFNFQKFSEFRLDISMENSNNKKINLLNITEIKSEEGSINNDNSCKEILKLFM
jgi:hypothetical protein